MSYHGIALNVTVRLPDFDLIDACGLPGVESTSIGRESGWESGPTIQSVARAASAFAPALAAVLGAPLAGNLPPAADPTVARAVLEEILMTRSSAVVGVR